MVLRGGGGQNQTCSYIRANDHKKINNCVVATGDVIVWSTREKGWGGGHRSHKKGNGRARPIKTHHKQILSLFEEGSTTPGSN